MSQENVEMVRSLYREWESGDFWGMSELYAPDVEWQWSREARAVRGGGASYTGLGEIAVAMLEWLSDWGWFEISAEEFIDAGGPGHCGVRGPRATQGQPGRGP
jgi:hypothetical protein